jgi:hypothetical protein
VVLSLFFPTSSLLLPSLARLSPRGFSCPSFATPNTPKWRPPLSPGNGCFLVALGVLPKKGPQTSRTWTEASVSCLDMPMVWLSKFNGGVTILATFFFFLHYWGLNSGPTP